MAQVTVIGLGAMGSTLARVLAECGHDVTVWNRSGLRPERSAGLDGVAVAGSPAEAIAASPLTVMCVSHYAAAEETLDAPGATESLAGRVLVQLTNGGETQVRAQMARVRAAGGRMLSGGIMAYPRQIGRPDTVILYSGDASAYEEHRDTLARPGRRPALHRRGPGGAERRVRVGLRRVLRRAVRLSRERRAGREPRRRLSPS